MPNTLPVGLRLNNPGNLKWSPRIQWVGAAPANREGDKEAFATPVAGVRALMKDLLTGSRRLGDEKDDTVAEIIQEFAPPPSAKQKDNNPTKAYIDFVAKRLLVKPSQTITVDNYGTIRALVLAIGRFEQGMELPESVYTEDVLEEAARAAGVHNAPALRAMKDTAVQGAVVSGGGDGSGDRRAVVAACAVG